jgi:hypothetical protein
MFPEKSESGDFKAMALEHKFETEPNVALSDEGLPGLIDVMSPKSESVTPLSGLVKFG